MKCPDRFNIVQHNIRKPILNRDDIAIGEYHLLIENQGFADCYKEECERYFDSIRRNENSGLSNGL